MSELLLESIQPTSTVQKVDSVTVAEQVSVNRSLQASATSRLLDDLVSSPLGDVAVPPFPRPPPVGHDDIGVTDHCRGRCGSDPPTVKLPGKADPLEGCGLTTLRFPSIAVPFFYPRHTCAEPTPTQARGVWGDFHAPGALWHKEGLETLSEEFDAA